MSLEDDVGLCEFQLDLDEGALCDGGVRLVDEVAEAGVQFNRHLGFQDKFRDNFSTRELLGLK